MTTIYLSNWSSHKTPGMHGPGRKWSAMAAPRSWEIGDGVLNCVAPDLSDLRDVQAGRIDLPTYRHRYEGAILRRQAAFSMLTPTHLHPGWRPREQPPAWGAVADGDEVRATEMLRRRMVMR